MQGKPGAALLVPPDLITSVARKGVRSEHDCYSSFREDGGNETGLKTIPQGLGATKLTVYVLVADVCVKITGLHALENGFQATVVLSLSRGISAEGIDAAVEEMREKGATTEE